MRSLKFSALFVLVFLVSLIGYDYAHRTARADGAGGSAVVDAGAAAALPEVTPTPAPTADGSGSGSAVTPAPTTKPSDTLHDPVSAPVATFDDVKAAKKVGWGAAVFAVLLILFRLLGKAQNTPWLAWLGKGRTAVIVAASGAIVASCYDIAAQGGSWTAILMAGAMAFAAFWNSHPAPPKTPA